MAAASPISVASWQTLLDNFAIHEADFGGQKIGILQRLREISGFLAVAIVYILLVMREQKLAYVSLVLLRIRTAITGLFPSIVEFYVTTVVMSVGFHYYETVSGSLALQWIDKDKAPQTLGKILAAGSAASVLTFCIVWAAFEHFQVGYAWTYVLYGGLITIIGLFCWFAFPDSPAKCRSESTC